MLIIQDFYVNLFTKFNRFHKVPDNIRRGQSLQIRIALSDETETLLIPRSGFYQQTGDNWIFKLNKDGDKVVVSSYENYGEIQELVIK